MTDQETIYLGMAIISKVSCAYYHMVISAFMKKGENKKWTEISLLRNSKEATVFKILFSVLKILIDT
jgi:hypothetical protein